jgi:lysophospholipase L1-like esterase
LTYTFQQADDGHVLSLRYTDASLDTPLVLALSTPITKNGETDVLAEQNAAVLEKNEAVLRIAKKYGLPVHDLYAAVVGKAHLRSADGYHYNAEGYEILGGLVAEGILALL